MRRARANQGKLKALLGMPLDILFEVFIRIVFGMIVPYCSHQLRHLLKIAAKLQPRDILHLSRVSTDFRALFMSRSAKHIWVAARTNVPGLPDCPEDLSEPRYAHLVFERNPCDVLGSTFCCLTGAKLLTGLWKQNSKEMLYITTSTYV
jgi:hypothetical protein